MLSNAYFLAKIGADTAENEQHFAEILPTNQRAKSPSRLTPQAREHLGLARLGMSTVIYLSGMKL